MRKMADVTTLRQKRIDLSDKFAAKCAKSERFGHWFPENQKHRHSSRGRVNLTRRNLLDAKGITTHLCSTCAAG